MEAKLQLFIAETSKRFSGKKVSMNSDLYDSHLFIYQFKIFAILWAIASLFHMAHSSVFNAELNYALLTLASFYVIFRPSLPSFVVFISLQIFDAVYRMPHTTNHWIFTSFVNITILQVLLYMIFQKRSFFISEGDLIRKFAPVVRIEVIVLYFFTAFHKLNAAFFNPSVSCATDLLEAQNIDWLIPSTPEILLLNAYVTVVLEFLIPVFLCFRQTRNGAIVFGLFFHGVLAYSTYNAFYDFSSMIFAVYFLFYPSSFSGWIIKKFDEVRLAFYKRFKQFNISRLIVLTGVLIGLIGMVYLMNKNINAPEKVNLYFFWSTFLILYMTIFVFGIWKTRKSVSPASGEFVVQRTSFVIMPVIVFLNGFSPYLGLKTDNSFSMFSNLRTEGGESNHYLIPSGMQLFNYQKDVVEILSSSDPWLQRASDRGQLMIFADFRNQIVRRKPAEVHYLLNGEQQSFFMTDEAYRAMRSENSYLFSKFMGFRLFSKEEPQPCKH